MAELPELDKSYSIEQFHADMLKRLFDARLHGDMDYYAKLLTAYIMYLQSLLGDSKFDPLYVYRNASKFEFFAVIGDMHRALGLMPTRVYITPGSMFGYFANRLNKLRVKGGSND